MNQEKKEKKCLSCCKLGYSTRLKLKKLRATCFSFVCVCSILIFLLALICFIFGALIFHFYDRKIPCSFGYAGKKCNKECGKSFMKPIGGQQSLPNSWPSLALIEVIYTSNLTLDDNSIFTSNQIIYCSGTLINEITVLTAAHCIDYGTLSLKFKKNETLKLKLSSSYSNTVTINVYFGAYNISNLNDAFKYKVKDKIIHDSFDRVNQLNDIALLKLESPVILTKKVQLACLPRINYSNRAHFSVGWAQQNNIQNDLPLILVENQICNHTSKSKNWENQFCAIEKSTLSECQRNTGKMVYISQTVNSKNRFVVTGITSYDSECTIGGNPVTFTRVSSFIKWIDKNI